MEMYMDEQRQRLQSMISFVEIFASVKSFGF